MSLGLNEATGKEWFGQAGGVIPAFVSVPPSDRFLSFAEREEIFCWGGARRLHPADGEAPESGTVDRPA